MVNSALSLLSLLFMVTTNHVANSQLLDTLAWSWNTVNMPYKVSDIVGTFVQGANGDEDGFIILTGGCDHENGNVKGEGDDKYFYCNSVTKKALKFDPFGNYFTELKSAPRERYRHAAVAIGQKVFLIGGRDVKDALVAEIDIYDTKTGNWTTGGVLPEPSSDLTAWVHENHIFVSGGYNVDYSKTFSTTYKIDINDLSLDGDRYSQIVKSTAVKPMSGPRGDMHSVEYEGYVYVVGGFSGEDWCKPLNLAERYHIKTDTWETLNPIKFDRADMAVTELFGKIMVIGGESKLARCDDDVAGGSIPQNHVEVFDPLKKKWLLYSPFNDYRFRFGAVAVKAQGRVYTFGGQLHYNEECRCFPSSNQVAIAQENLTQVSSSGLSDGAIAGIVVGCVAGVVGFLSLAWYFSQSDKLVDTAMLGEVEFKPEEKA